MDSEEEEGASCSFLSFVASHPTRRTKAKTPAAAPTVEVRPPLSSSSAKRFVIWGSPKDANTPIANKVHLTMCDPLASMQSHHRAGCKKPLNSSSKMTTGL